MSKVIKLREYFVAWLLYVLSSGIVVLLMRGIKRGLDSTVTYESEIVQVLTVLCIELVIYIVGCGAGFILFTLIVKSKIVRKVEERVKQAAQTAGESLAEC